MAQINEFITAKFRLKLKKVGKTTRPFSIFSQMLFFSLLMFHFWLLSIFRNLLYLHNWLISYIYFIILVVSLNFTIYIFITVYLQILLCHFQYSIKLTMVYFQFLPMVFHSITVIYYLIYYYDFCSRWSIIFKEILK